MVMTTKEKMVADAFPSDTMSREELFMRTREGLIVKRCHTVRVLNTQTVGEHTAGVLQLLVYVYPEATASLMRAVLNHDIAESVMGDIPATTKKLSGLVKMGCHELEQRINESLRLNVDVTDEERAIIKTCDYMDLAAFCLSERKMGNTYCDTMFMNCILLVRDGIRESRGGEWSLRAGRLMHHLYSQFVKAGGPNGTAPDSLEI